VDHQLDGIDESILSVLTEYEEHRLRENLRMGRRIYKVHASFDLLAIDVGIEALKNQIVLALVRREEFALEAAALGITITDAEVAGLRSYLLAGGFLVVDDFWGTYQWAVFEHEITRVLPEHAIVDVSMSHPLLRTFYDIDEVLQVPNVWQGRTGGPTWERDGYVPHLRGIFDERGRLMVVINFNSDLGDAWEWAEDPFYPLPYSNYAYQIGVNMIVYGMSR
jgi:hypothetical protein